MDSKEAAQRLSDIRLGSDLGILQHIQSSNLNELLVMTQPGFLQHKYNTVLSAEDRDTHRAKMIRETLSKSKS